jgi:hypothetical protein
MSATVRYDARAVSRGGTLVKIPEVIAMTAIWFRIPAD